MTLLHPIHIRIVFRFLGFRFECKGVSIPVIF
jgi:hypothetical protein